MALKRFASLLIIPLVIGCSAQNPSIPTQKTIENQSQSDASNNQIGNGQHLQQNGTAPPWQGTGKTLSPEERQQGIEGRDARQKAWQQQQQNQQ
ncbi:hypothetical protein GJ688_12945 [Heliobacillus mobilis]|uniref:Lipoprotein n=1 Tax=Heliobacterium mobile TaxID=28064 RepID=A0A6I3SLR1_HELMO|nr:hypothetical protein [Heliobacterium mobile]MTV49880.1 hypothetical protein [Heliobacterium mobile]